MTGSRIGARLAMGFGFVIVLLLIMSAIGAWRILASQQDNQALSQRLDTDAYIQQLSRAVNVEATRMQTALSGSPDTLHEMQRVITTADGETGALVERLSARLTDPEAAKALQDFSDRRDAFGPKRDQALKDIDKGLYAEIDAFFGTELPQTTAALLADIDQMSKIQAQDIHETFERSERGGDLGLMVLAVATLLALLLSPLFAWRVTRSITRPLHHAVDLARAVADRDLSMDIHSQRRDEIGQLLTALATMVSNLREALGDVRHGSEAIASATSQMVAGNLDLSSRTEEQASSLAQTAATMEEITATVRQNADNTQQANTLAETAAKTAVDGGGIVSNLVATMGEINTQSQQVADIINVIDGIAFQTNILALNAAVEAARAGEQGRGFAVVASEVRALAQRSAGAAKEIKALIDTSVEAAARGNEQASQAGGTMREIVDDIKRVTDIMGEINAANREQTTGIEEVNSAVSQMDDVTRQNASLVEQSAAATSALQAQADSLARLVATFTLSQEAEGEAGPLLDVAQDAMLAAAPTTEAERLGRELTLLEASSA